MDACEIRAPGAGLLRKSELQAEKSYANGRTDAAVKRRGSRDDGGGTCYSEEASVAEMPVARRPRRRLDHVCSICS
jgi:hypothetical protein